MRRVAGAAAIIFLGNVASRALGLVRELVIAARFGATGATSAYRTAAQLATQAYDLLISGAISAALVPVFTDYADAPDRRAFARVVSVVLNLLLLALAVVLLALGLAAPLALSPLWPPGDERIVALAIGLVLGAFLQAAIQLPGLRDVGYLPVLD